MKIRKRQKVVKPKIIITQKKLDEISLRVGKLLQVVAYHSSDIARGIKFYKQENEELIYTHDVTDAMALLLKIEVLSTYLRSRDHLKRSY